MVLLLWNVSVWVCTCNECRLTLKFSCDVQERWNWHVCKPMKSKNGHSRTTGSLKGRHIDLYIWTFIDFLAYHRSILTDFANYPLKECTTLRQGRGHFCKGDYKGKFNIPALSSSLSLPSPSLSRCVCVCECECACVCVTSCALSLSLSLSLSPIVNKFGTNN